VRTIADAFEQIGLVERAFQVEAPWRGHFYLDGHRVRCSLDSDGWLQLSSFLPGDERDLVRRQSGLLVPVKIISGPTVIAELPMTETVSATFVGLRSVLHGAIAQLVSPPQEASVDEQAETDVARRIHAVLEETAFTWDRDGGHLSTNAGAAAVMAESIGRAVVFRTTVVHLAAGGGPSMDALTHFVLALNARFRLIRASFLPGRLVQEVALPEALLAPALADRAVRALSESCRMTKRACAALADGRVAERYLEFHERQDIDADTHHRRDGLEPLAGRGTVGTCA
jgi:hypothetical protein